MNQNRFVLHKLQPLLQISAALSRKITAAAHPLPERRFRPLFPLYSAARAEAADNKAVHSGGVPRTSRQSSRRITVP